MDAQLKKGVLELCLLASVAKEPRYGYDVIRGLREDFPEVDDSAFYAVLRRLHRVRRAAPEILPIDRTRAGGYDPPPPGLEAPDRNCGTPDRRTGLTRHGCLL